MTPERRGRIALACFVTAIALIVFLAGLAVGYRVGHRQGVKDVVAAICDRMTLMPPLAPCEEKSELVK